MFRSILSVQWKWSRLSVLLLTLPIVALPFWSMSALRPSERPTPPSPLEYMSMASVCYMLTAAVAGFLLAMHAWRTDHQGRNVYALSLPIERWRFAVYRYGAGVLFAGLILLAFWISTLSAVAVFGVPEGLKAYPTALTVRVGLALLVCYAAFSAVWSNTRHAAYVIAAALVLYFVPLLISEATHSTAVVDAYSAVWNALGMREMFGGRWFLIDV